MDQEAFSPAPPEIIAQDAVQAESPVAERLAPPKLKRSRTIKRDCIDYARRGMGENMVAGVAGAIAGFAGPNIVAGDVGSLNMLVGAGVEAVGHSVTFDRYPRERYYKEHVFRHPVAGYSIEEIVYKGKKSLQTSSSILEKNQTFMLARLPERIVSANRDDPTGEEQQLITQSYREVLLGMQDALNNTYYTHIAIELDPQQQGDLFPPDVKRFTREDLLVGKRVDVKAPKTEYALLTREQFEALVRPPVPQETMTQVLAEVHNETITALIYDLEHAATKEEREAIKGKIEGVLVSHMHSQLTLLTSSEREFKRVSKFDPPSLYRVDSGIRILPPDRDRPLKFQTISDNKPGTVYDPGEYLLLKPQLERLLGRPSEEHSRDSEQVKVAVNDPEQVKTVIEEITSPYGDLAYISELRLTYLAYELLQAYDVNPQGDKKMSPMELRDALEQRGITFMEAPSIATQIYQKKRRLISPFMTGAAIGAAMYVASPYVDEAVTDIAQGTIGPMFGMETPFWMRGHSIIGQSRDISVGYPESTGTPEPLWKIEGHNMEAPIYYYSSTMDHYDAQLNKWIAVTQKADKQLAIPSPDTLDPNGQYVVLSGWQENSTFKLLLAPDTQVGALELKDIHGNIVGYKTITLADGTIEVTVDNQNFGFYTGPVFVTEWLVPQDAAHRVNLNPQIKQLDMNKLSPQARELIDTLQKQADDSGRSFKDVLLDYIQQHYTYSIAPDKAQEVTNAPSLEDKVNAMIADNKLDCDTASTLVAALEAGRGSPITLGTGFIHIPSISSWLYNLEGHDFLMTPDGHVIDPTVLMRLANPLDKATQSYFDLLHGQSNHVAQEQEKSIFAGLQERAEHQEKIENAKRALELIGEGTAAAIAVYVLAKNRERILAMKEAVVRKIPGYFVHRIEKEFLSNAKDNPRPLARSLQTLLWLNKDDDARGLRPFPEEHLLPLTVDKIITIFNAMILGGGFNRLYKEYYVPKGGDRKMPDIARGQLSQPEWEVAQRLLEFGAIVQRECYPDTAEPGYEFAKSRYAPKGLNAIST